MRSRTLLLAALAAACATAAGAVTAQAAPSGSGWTRVSGPAEAGPELGLARTADGVLHVIWGHGTGTSTISDTRISPSGSPLGTSTVASGWDGNAGLALLTMPDGSLRLFAAGGHTPGLGVSAVGINTLTAPAAGIAWALDQGAVWGGASGYSAGSVGAALAGGGQPVSAWAGAGLAQVHVGLDPSGATVTFGSDMLTAELVADASGAVVLSGITIGHPAGTLVQQVLPSPGPQEVLPSSTDGRSSGLAARIGGPGVFDAYTDGTTVRLHRYGGGTEAVATGPFQTAKAFAGPEGRLWIAWGSSSNGLFVTRSNKAVTRFEPVQTLKLPASTTTLEGAEGEGSTGPLDLFADVLVGGNDRGFWQRHVLPRCSLYASVKKTKTGGKVTFSVRDAGDPLAGAIVLVRGKKLKTGSAGSVSVQLPPGSYAATATPVGYLAVSTKFHV